MYVLLETVFPENCFPEILWEVKYIVTSYLIKQKSREIENQTKGLNAAGYVVKLS